MKDEHSLAFISALERRDLSALRQIPKSDLHNHFVLGGDREALGERTGIAIPPLTKPISSMDEMHRWNDEHIAPCFNSPEGRRMLIDACFIQAKKDGVRLLVIGEDVWGLGEYFHHNPQELVDAFLSAQKRYAPETQLRPQIGLSRHCSVASLQRWIEPFWELDVFSSIDLYGDEFAQDIEVFVPIYRKAKEKGLCCKAHIGEWGTAEDVKRGVELLNLDEVQHGIAAAASSEITDFLTKRKIRLNITPTSNILLGRVKSMAEHPIQILYRAGVEVSINSDDILIFDSDVSKEYLRLYQAQTLTAEELDDIRIRGLQ